MLFTTLYMVILIYLPSVMSIYLLLSTRSVCSFRWLDHLKCIISCNRNLDIYKKSFLYHYWHFYSVTWFLNFILWSLGLICLYLSWVINWLLLTPNCVSNFLKVNLYTMTSIWLFVLTFFLLVLVYLYAIFFYLLPIYCSVVGP